MPTSKRKRNSDAASHKRSQSAATNASQSDDDYQSMSSGDDNSDRIVRRVRSSERGVSTASTAHGARDTVNDHYGGGENGEAELMRMDAPPQAGIIHPDGYKTNIPTPGRQVRVYADGVFDLFHLGHMRQLEQAKKAFQDIYLIVGVTGDRETHKRKGLTVMSAKERSESVRHCKWVDEVIEDCPWVITVDFLQKYNIDYVAHDDLPYGASEGDDIYKPIKERGMFLVTQRTEGVSTTGIITRIVRDYESYISRQLKRGTSRQELNISWFKKNELDIKRQVNEIRTSIKENWTTTGQELGKEFRQFWQPSGANSPAPTDAHRGRRNDMSEATLESPTSATGNSWAARTARSPGAWSRFSINSGGDAPTRDKDFAAGYAMGLIGGVRSWMQRNRRNLSDGSRAPSPTSDEMDDERDEDGKSRKNASDDDDAHDTQDSTRAHKRGRAANGSETRTTTAQTTRS